MTDDFVCVIGQNQWPEKSELTRTDYEQAEHVIVRPPGKLTTGVFKVLEDLGLHRKIKHQVTHFHYLASIITTTSLIATIPRRIGIQLSTIAACKVVEVPVDLGYFPFHLAWHQRFQSDPAHHWVRQAIKVCCKNV
jgi:DNA-binding transcriptional LysR family regulator